MKKIALSLLALFALMILVYFVLNTEEEVEAPVENEMEMVQGEIYDHMPSSPFEFAMRDYLDDAIKTKLGYERVITQKTVFDASFGYELDAPMEEEDFYTLEEIFEDANLEYSFEGNYEANEENPKDWSGNINVNGEEIFWIGYLRDDVLWFSKF